MKIKQSCEGNPVGDVTDGVNVGAKLASGRTDGCTEGEVADGIPLGMADGWAVG